ncbi:WD40-repeat-containing domain protein [Mycena vulgaris]|nr:WD40-repeat-containing domain protein [Mycena vulgaris]
MSNYCEQGALRGHNGSIYPLAATEDGNFLASGGKDGTRIWVLNTMSQIPDRPAGAGMQGMTTALTWANRADEPGDILFFGTIKGYMGQPDFNETWCQRIGSDASEITGLAFVPLSNRLGLSNWNADIQLWALTASVPAKIYSIKINGCIPKSIQFGVMRGNQRELLVFGYHDGKMRVCVLKSSILTTSHLYLVVPCGDSCIDESRTTVCIDDLDFGAVPYRLNDHCRLKTFHVPDDSKRPRQVRFIDDSRTIVMGSDHGTVYVFDRRTGAQIDKLMVDGGGWIQAIAVRTRLETADINGIPTIFAAKGGEGVGQNDIVVWRKTAAWQPYDTVGEHSPWNDPFGVAGVCVP